MLNEPQPADPGGRKQCDACGKFMPADETDCPSCAQRQAPEKSETGKRLMGWVGIATALAGLVASLAGGVSWLTAHSRHQRELKARMSTAQVQAKQGEYEAAVRTYGEILKDNPVYASAMKEQLNTTMQWVEDFHVLGRDDQSSAEHAAALLDEIMPVLNAGLARAKGPEAADIQSHLGWAHWLNWHIAEREYTSTAEQDFRAALAMDPSNVYANAMLGNWMLQNHGNFAEAIGHLATAVSTRKARPYVRSLQLGGLIYEETRGARAELVKIANEMRKSGEPLDEDSKHRILGFCCDVAVTNHAELVESLSAVPEDEAWKTYLWLDDMPPDSDDAQSARWLLMKRDFIHANILEISGKLAESLEIYRQLKKELKSRPGSFQSAADEGVTRLSRSH